MPVFNSSIEAIYKTYHVDPSSTPSTPNNEISKLGILSSFQKSTSTPSIYFSSVIPLPNQSIDFKNVSQLTVNRLIAEVKVNRANAYLFLKRLDECIEDCTDAIKNGVSTEVVHRIRGNAYFEKGIFEKFLFYLVQSFKI